MELSPSSNAENNACSVKYRMSSKHAVVEKSMHYIATKDLHGGAKWSKRPFFMAQNKNTSRGDL